jgi:glycosyltransferase involved in cell wall biosynthesis
MPHQLDLLQRASAVVAQTELERSYLAQEGIPLDHIHVIPPGVDLEAAGRADGGRFRATHGLNGRIVLALGSPSRDKGTADLQQAIGNLRREGVPVTLVLAGSGTEHLSVADPGSGTHRASCVLGLGKLTASEKWDAIAAADVVAQPSRTESFGITYLEAWARGKPVIGAHAGAVPCVIEDGIDGILVPFGNPRVLAQAISDLLGDAELAASMGQEGREKVRRTYLREHQAGRFRSLVEGLV